MSIYTSATDIYKSILYTAADIYDVEYDDIERDIAQHFDPIVRFMSGALASELERVYQQLHDTESRLQKRLASVLLPEHLHLPKPAHALAYAKPNSDALVIDETTELRLDMNEDRNDIAFSPVFATRLLPVDIAWIATDTQLVEYTTKSERRRNQSGELESTRRIAIGFNSTEPITNWQNVSLHLDIQKQAKIDSRRDVLFAALYNAECYFQHQPLVCFRGLPPTENILEDYLNGTEQLQQSVRARYGQEFLTFTQAEYPELETVPSGDYLYGWFNKTLSSEEVIETELNEIDKDEKLYWLEVHLNRPIKVQQLAKRLQVRFNVFPVLNRRLNGHSKGEHHFFKNNSIKWISLQPKEDFVSIRRVYEDKATKAIFEYKPFADFKDSRTPSYTMRHGGVGRWDNFNAWQRLTYLVNILQNNYKQEELIEQAATALSLEDIHHLLGKRISKEAQEEKPTRDIYVLLHAGTAQRLRARVEYWTSIGDEANNLSVKSTVRCVSKQKSDIELLSLVSPPEGGRAALNSSQQLVAMKGTLLSNRRVAMKDMVLSRVRIVTREDVKVFCEHFLEGDAKSIEVVDSVGIDPRYDFGMTRILEVRIQASTRGQKADWEGVSKQLQHLLQQKSTTSIPIQVIAKL